MVCLILFACQTSSGILGLPVGICSLYISVSSPRPSLSMSSFDNFPLFHTNRKDILKNIKEVEHLNPDVVLLPFRSTTGICNLWRLLLCRLFCYWNLWSNHLLLLLLVCNINDGWKILCHLVTTLLTVRVVLPPNQEVEEGCEQIIGRWRSCQHHGGTTSEEFITKNKSCFKF